MEFLDAAAERRHHILLFVGYGLLAIAVAMGSLILLYLSYGYSLSTKGEVRQNGIVFVASNPDGATITTNGVQQTNQTNTRLSLQSGTYDVSVHTAGTLPWRHDITVRGGDVQRLDYIRLFPQQLATTNVLNLANPAWVSPSPDKRWLLVAPSETDQTHASQQFSLYDVKNITKPIESELVLPTTVYTGGTAGNWTPLGWGNDNRHVLLRHDYTLEENKTHEYILLDRINLAASLNLTRTYSLPAEEVLSLFDNKYDVYIAHNVATGSLRTFSAAGTVPIAPLTGIKAFRTDGKVIVYVTDTENGKPLNGKLAVVYADDSRQITLRYSSLPLADGPYMLATARYDNMRYVAVGAPGENGVYLYQNPLDQTVETGALPTPWRLLRTTEPAAYVAFSDNGRFLLAARNLSATVYDAELVAVRRYQLRGSIEAPETAAVKHVVWFDGYRVGYVSGGLFTVVDYDGQNPVSLQPSGVQILPFVSNDGKYVVSFVSTESGSITVSATALTVK